MPNTPRPTDQEQVTLHIQKLDGSIRDTIQMLREIILNTDAEISEQIKWNNPAFFYYGEMKPFDPKEYKRDMIVFNLFKNRDACIPERREGKRYVWPANRQLCRWQARYRI